MSARLRWLVVASAILTGCGLPVPPPASTAPPSSTTADLVGGLARPRVAEPDPARTRYSRDAWQPHGWEDADGDGCNTREEVLLAAGSAVRVGPGCRIEAGEWTDRYTGRTVTNPSQLQIDHMVALADASASGGWAWSPERKIAFANDLDGGELNAVWGAENERKADYGPDRWMPPSAGARCWYVSTYASIKSRWGLTVTPAQWEAIERVWAGCGATP